MMQEAIVCATILFGLSALSEPQQAQTDTASKAPPIATVPDVTSLTLDELIAQLPAAGDEWRWDNARGDGVAHPASEEMARRIDKCTELSDDQWRLVLLQTKAIRYHRRWPRDEEYRISLTVPRWLGITQIRLEPQLKGMRTATAGELMMGFSGTIPMMRARDARLGLPIGKVPEGTTEIIFHVELERGESVMAGFLEDDKSPPPGMLWKGTVRVPVELVDEFDQTARPVDNEELVASVRDAVGAGLRQWGERLDLVPFVVIDPDCTKFPILETTGLDIKVELLDGEHLLAESWLVAGDFDQLSLCGSIHRGKVRFYGTTNLKAKTEGANTTNWVLRLTGCEDHIWLLWHAEQRWDGSITIPWTEAVAHEVERTRECGRGPDVSTPYMR